MHHLFFFPFASDWFGQHCWEYLPRLIQWKTLKILKTFVKGPNPLKERSLPRMRRGLAGWPGESWQELISSFLNSQAEFRPSRRRHWLWAKGPKPMSSSRLAFKLAPRLSLMSHSVSVCLRVHEAERNVCLRTDSPSPKTFTNEPSSSAWHGAPPLSTLWRSS